MAGFTLPHTLHGDGPHRVVAVHGWLADRGDYAAVLPDLDAAVFTYAFVDLRGYGEARHASGAFTTSEGARDVLALADRLGWHRFSLIGHSMGGAVVQRVLAAAPDRVRRMVGISPVPASGMPMDEETRALFTEAADYPAKRRAIIDLTTGGNRPDAWLDRMTWRSVERSDPKAFRAWLDSWSGEDFHEETEGSPVPALAVCGALDPAINAAFLRGTWLRWYPAGQLVELPLAGHHPMDETPLDLIRTVEDFLRADHV
ncbi:alpha/beta hydrolase [Streptomyces sp. ASQP_92]|uniref:alpha/beta fold hydrolase n=1 Tax=Streptomyces sp. ASQP_92 TaxID=2979116 RepID=UPI0021C005B9|nr:alpha/beta hydrolase [Streptomyces sp. ASQP_92]MCT9089997.1 alpha/beta hydrolase [Streptomyces sp. ASQP_92]